MNNFCALCPNGCSADRSVAKGACGVGNTVRIAKYYLHKFEEPVISGKNGSGTVFFCGCSLRCVFCQNYEVSRNLRGKEVTTKELADIFRDLELSGAHNVNLVNPTHYSDKIAEALTIYKPGIPVVYNTHGYEKLDVLEKIDKYIDIYLPDMKFYSPAVSERYTGKSNYFAVARDAVEFMAEKPYVVDENGLLKSGTVVRHLVLPQNVSDSKKILEWFVRIKDKAYINVMRQYTPFGKIENFKELQRKLTEREYRSVIDYALSLGIENMFFQEKESSDVCYIPEWDF